MVKIKFIILGICLWAGGVNAQRAYVSDTITLSGIIINTVTDQPMPDVSCRYGNRGTLSNSDGLFSIRVGRHDTVRFTYVGFKPYVVVVPDSLTDKEYMLGVFMAPDTLMLSEAVIVRRFGEDRRQKLMYARNNMAGVMKQAYTPAKEMDADMNQRMMVNNYARSVEMRGHVDVGLAVGTQSIAAYKQLRFQKKMKDRQVWLDPGEIDLLKKIYYIEKRKNENN